MGGLELAANAVVSAGVALVGYVVPLWQARKARAKVTPLADPVDERGEQLVPAGGIGGLGLDDRALGEPQRPGVADHAAPEVT